MNDAPELLLDITVLRPDGQMEHLVIPHARVLVGTGAHCDIRIDGLGAAREHLELELQGERLLARARASSPPPLLRGTPLVAGVVESGSQLAVCGTRITVRVVRENQPRARSPVRRVASVGAALAALAFPAVVFAALRAPNDEGIGPPPKFTPLWE